ncbi:AraC family transcriptional regulator ligand-binding domain-containing protein [Fusibacter paucivorans]|uniref:AraC family transcriptional regulator ligand-binding domain-containing protein n=1 Tax=Fusibacter paucivorans TaxID=76009 RepID=A0ABS5PUS3_9FIRM|nr:AraC family transcriptional regulator [Fusibacter paucivorans]MBS7528331.1 AraC family transcriptional regulator ligand-binding domain-containing protein [Fusibacter paucivorans]
MNAKKYLLDGNYKLLLTEMGVDLSDFLKRAKLPYNLFDMPQPLINTEEYYSLWRVLTHYDADMTLPLLAGKSIRPEMFSPVMIVALASQNGKMALNRIIKYKRLVAPLTLKLNVKSDYVDLSFYSEADDEEMPLGLAAFEMIFMNGILSIGTGKVIKPLMVQTESPLPSSAYADYFGIEPQVGTESFIRFSTEDLEREFCTKNQAVWDFYLNALDSRMAAERPQQFSDIVKRNIVEVLSSGSVSIETIAAEIGFSRRTVQRKLAEEETTFQEQLNNVRKELAQMYLRDTNISTKEIAFLLGYDETNSFLRAFKLWTGKTIREYREVEMQ